MLAVCVVMVVKMRFEVPVKTRPWIILRRSFREHCMYVYSCVRHCNIVILKEKKKIPNFY